jgi:hypothetical protein
MLAGPVASAHHMMARGGDMMHGSVSWFGRKVQWFKDILAGFWQVVRPHTLADFVGKHPKECAAVALIASAATVVVYRSFFTGKRTREEPGTPFRD